MHAGDHLQLPPTVLSDKAATGGLATTLFERLHRMHGHAAHMLTTQYRMHADIMTWASDALYKGRLQAHCSVAAHTLADIQNRCAAFFCSHALQPASHRISLNCWVR